MTLFIRELLVFRGGTALNKIYFNPPERYSEDIDFVQIKAAPIGQTINAIRVALDHWLGEPKRKLTERGIKLIYQYLTQENRKGKLKIEINTTEHYHVLDLISHEFSVNSGWFSGKSLLKTYQLNELMVRNFAPFTSAAKVETSSMYGFPSIKKLFIAKPSLKYLITTVNKMEKQ